MPLFFIQFIFFLGIHYSHAQTKINKLPEWAFGGFERPVKINPIISPDSNAVFLDPISGKENHWESDNTFNPAAAIKDGTILSNSIQHYDKSHFNKKEKVFLSFLKL